jgi:hypothetical protein
MGIKMAATARSDGHSWTQEERPEVIHAKAAARRQ